MIYNSINPRDLYKRSASSEAESEYRSKAQRTDSLTSPHAVVWAPKEFETSELEASELKKYGNFSLYDSWNIRSALSFCWRNFGLKVLKSDPLKNLFVRAISEVPPLPPIQQLDLVHACIKLREHGIQFNFDPVIRSTVESLITMMQQRTDFDSLVITLAASYWKGRCADLLEPFTDAVLSRSSDPQFLEAACKFAIQTVDTCCDLSAGVDLMRCVTCLKKYPIKPEQKAILNKFSDSAIIKLSQANDTLIVWKKLATEIGEDPGIQDLGPIDTIKKSLEFSQWIAAHHEKLSQIEKLDLSKCNLKSVPDAIGQLTNLKELNLGINEISTLPDSICQLANLQTLNLRSNKITALPDSMSQLTNLQKLDLYWNHITTLPDIICQLRNLRELKLGSNELTTLPDSMSQLTNLHKLDLSHNRFTTLPDSMSQLTNLHNLDLSHNRFTTLPDSMSQLTNLQVLDLSYNQITTLPDSIGQLANLQTLNLKRNQIINLSDSIGQLANLQTLDLSYNHLTSLPDTICQLINLRNFVLSNNQITTLPDMIWQLLNLQELYLDSNKITTLTDSNIRRTNLQKLILSSNELATLPDLICQLTNLQMLDLSSNQLTTLPESIGELTNLQKLNLHYNLITTLPDSIDKLTNLQKLYLSYNEITTLPDSFDKFTNLQELKLSRNQITTLPDSIGKLSNLQELHLSDNHITTLPDSINKLTNLQELHLSDNHITTLPDSINKLTNLQKLKLSRNQITTLPDSIGQLTNLLTLELSGNQITTLPNSIGQLTNLLTLRLSNNRIRYLPNTFSQLTNLVVLDLDDNQLTTLPNFLALLQARSIISAENNRFFAENLQAFQAHLANVRRENPLLGPRCFFNVHESHGPETNSLEEAMVFWLRAFQKEFPGLCIDAQRYPATESSKKNECLAFYETLMSHPNKDRLLRFLNRLKNIQDFKKGGSSRQNVILRTGRMLERAAVNEKFRDILFAILEEALSSCGDRVTLAFNMIELQWLLSQAGEVSDLELVRLLIGLKRIDMLNEIAKNRIQELRLGDNIEVYLYYQVKLKDALRLPVSTQSMLYEGMAGISDALLIEDKDKVIASSSSLDHITQILLEYKEWEKKIKANHHDAFAKFNEEISGRISEITDNHALTELQKQEQINLLTIQQKQWTEESVAQHTSKYVSIHLSEINGLPNDPDQMHD